MDSATRNKITNYDDRIASLERTVFELAQAVERIKRPPTARPVSTTQSKRWAACRSGAWNPIDSAAMLLSTVNLGHDEDELRGLVREKACAALRLLDDGKPGAAKGLVAEILLILVELS